METLLLSPVPLGTGTDGTRLRGQGLLSGLSRLGSVKLLCFDELQGGGGDCPLPRWPGEWERLLSPTPSLVRCFQSRAFGELVRKEAASRDLCVCLGLQMAQYLPCLPVGMPTVLDNYNVESNILWGLSRQRKGLKRLYWSLQAFKLQRFERWALQRASTVLAISANDREGFQRLVPDCRIELVPPGLDLEPFLGTRGQPKPEQFVFVGALGWHVNVESCRWMVEEVWPKIRSRRPNASLRLVGRKPGPKVLELGQHEGVTVHPDVPEIVSFLEEAAVVVVPLPYGSGVQTKVIQGAAAGRPVVTSPIGLEGLGLRPDVHLLLGQDAQKFADQCVRLIEDPVLAAEIGRNGRLAVQEAYSQARLDRDLQRVCAALLSR